MYIRLDAVRLPNMPRISMSDLRLDSSSDSDSSDSSVSGINESLPKFDEFGRPLSKPVYSSLGESSVLSRVRDFLPIFRDATLQLSEPRVESQREPDVKLPWGNDACDLTESDDDSSHSSYGIEIDVGLGVFDVNGAVDEQALAQQGTPIVSVDHDLETDKAPDAQEFPLIQEIHRS